MKSFKQFIIEGGNVFKGKTGPIKIDHIEPTLNAYFKEMKRLFPQKASLFNTKKMIPLGSVGKKPISGDIDLGLDASDVLGKDMTDAEIAKWGLDPKDVHAKFQLLSKRARSTTPEQLMLKAFLSLLAVDINRRSKLVQCDEKKITPGNMFGFFPQMDAKGKNLGIGVQLDWMVGNLKWLKFSYYSDAYPVESNVKGLHRTQLMLSAFQVANLSFNHVQGVKDKTTGDVVAQNENDALSLLNNRLGVKITTKNVNNYYDLHAALKRMKKVDYDQMIDTYFKILDSTRADIPDDLQDEWKKRKTKLGLTGKFLPDNSKLRT